MLKPFTFWFKVPISDKAKIDGFYTVLEESKELAEFSLRSYLVQGLGPRGDMEITYLEGFEESVQEAKELVSELQGL